MLLGLAALIFLYLPARPVAGDNLSQAERLKTENDVRTAGAQILGVLGLVAGGFLTARTIQVNREGQITARFSRAIGQLGEDTKPDVRIGGIYALERIARDSRRDHGPVIEVLGGTDLRGSLLRGDFSRTIFDGALLNGALVYGRFNDASFFGTSFGRVYLFGVSLRNASLFEADLSRVALLNDADVRGAQFDAKTKWPPNFDPLAAGARRF